MYENITYEELKGLSDEQKTEALKELKELYPDNRELAKKLGTAPIAIANLIRKFIEGKSIGRVKKEDESTPEAMNFPEAVSEPQTRKNIDQEKPQDDGVKQQPELTMVPQKRTYNRKPKNQPKEKPEEEFEKVSEVIPDSLFKISLNKNNVDGQNLKTHFEGLSLLMAEGKKYKVTIAIEEV